MDWNAFIYIGLPDSDQPIAFHMAVDKKNIGLGAMDKALNAIRCTAGYKQIHEIAEKSALIAVAIVFRAISLRNDKLLRGFPGGFNLTPKRARRIAERMGGSPDIKAKLGIQGIAGVIVIAIKKGSYWIRGTLEDGSDQMVVVLALFDIVPEA